MIIKTKLSLGLGFLFLIIFSLIFLCSFYVQNLSKDSENILKDNYNSLIYANHMLLSVDEMKTSVTAAVFSRNKNRGYYLKLFEKSKAEFEMNSRLENGNITEIHEKEYVDILNKSSELFFKLSYRLIQADNTTSLYFTDFIQSYVKVKNAVISINDVNMQAIERKNIQTNKYAAGTMRNLAIMGSICFLLALGYFWYFPFYVTNPISYLSDKMVGLLKKSKINYDFESDDEIYILSQSISLVEEKLSAQVKKK